MYKDCGKNSMSPEIKLIALDLDGTLLNSQHQMTERTERALKAALEKGIQVVLATGKTFISGQRVIERLGLTTPGIYLQGLAIYNSDGSVRHQQKLDPEVARQVLTYAEERGYKMAAYSGQRILVRTITQDILTLNEQYHEPKPEAVGPLQNILDDTPINKLLAVQLNDPRRITALRWQLNAQLGSRAKLTQALSDMLEILPPGASKGAALKVLLRDMGVSPANVIAFGDGENDIEMLQLVGLGVAMGNAVQKLKDVASHVTGTNDEDGIAQALEKYIPAVATALNPPVEVAAPETSKAEAKAETENSAQNENGAKDERGATGDNGTTAPVAEQPAAESTQPEPQPEAKSE
jgi:Cof subfamily protein (haloacid dehalogenase superfamily)